MTDTFKPVRINEYFLKQIAAGLKKEIYDSMFKPIFEVLDSKTTGSNSKIDNYNPYHDKLGRFCRAFSSQLPTLEDYKKPKKDYNLPNIPQAILGKLGKKQKPLVLKKNIIEKNKEHHPDINIEDYNQILQEGIYSADVVFKTKEKDDYYNFVHYGEKYHPQILVELSETKDNYEIVNFYRVDDKHLEKKLKKTIKRVDNEGGKFLIDIEGEASKVGSLSNLEIDSIYIITDIRKDFNPYINTIYNDKSTLVNAINSGRIYYNDGAFRSSKPFSNAVADELEKLGAKYTNGAYYIERAMLPLEIENTLALVSAREAAKVAALNGLLLRLADTLRQDTAVKLFIEKATERMFKKLQTDLEESTSLKQVPVIDVSVDIPEIDIPDNIYEELDEFHPVDENYEKTTGKKNKKGKGKGKGKDKGGNKGGGSSGSGSGNNPPINPNSNGADNPPKDDNGNPPTDETSDSNNPPKDDKDTDETPKPKPPKINLDDVIIDKKAKKIAQDYTYNMDYWVKNWKAKEIVKMRRTVLHLTQNGARTETIKKYFMDRWGIAERKAEFLARNESGIAGSVIKATHYQDMGCTHFMWLKSTSKEKRELHLEYAKKTGNQYGIGGTNIFSFSDPPIIEQIKVGNSFVPKPNGQKGLPGMTYNCSCGLVGIKNPQYYINREKIKNAKRNIFTKIKYTIENSMQRHNNPWRYRRFGEGA